MNFRILVEATIYELVIMLMTIMRIKEPCLNVQKSKLNLKDVKQIYINLKIL